MSTPKPSSKSSSAKKPRREGRAEVVIVRNLMAQSVLRRMVVIVFFAAACALLSVFSAVQVVRMKTPPQYLQLTEDGRILPISPLTDPNVAEGEILKFALDSIKWINTYDYINWRDQLQMSSDRFSPAGWNQYIDAFTAADTLNAVQQKKMVVSSAPKGQPRIVKQGVAASIGQYTWLIEVPVRVTYHSGVNSGNQPGQDNIQDGVVSLYVSRVPLEVSLRGYAIQVYQFNTSKSSEEYNASKSTTTPP